MEGFHEEAPRVAENVRLDQQYIGIFSRCDFHQDILF